MQIKYRIIEVHPDDQLIVVRFWSDITPEADLATEEDAVGNVLRCRTDTAISLPLPTPTGSDLDTLIMSCCPRPFFEMKEKIADPAIDTSLLAIQNLLGVEFVVNA